VLSDSDLHVIVRLCTVPVRNMLQRDRHQHFADTCTRYSTNCLAESARMVRSSIRRFISSLKHFGVHQLTICRSGTWKWRSWCTVFLLICAFQHWISTALWIHSVLSTITKTGIFIGSICPANSHVVQRSLITTDCSLNQSEYRSR
jgi:hypothetical protein